MDEKEYAELLESEGRVYHIHCGTCIQNMPKGKAPSQWRHIEAVFDVKKGLLIVGCSRCMKPIVFVPLPHELWQMVGECGCSACKEKAGHA